MIVKQLNQWKCSHLSQIFFVIAIVVESMRSNDQFLSNKLTELISDDILTKLGAIAPSNKITLIDLLSARKILEASMQNLCNFIIIELINLIVRVSNTDLFLVEHRTLVPTKNLPLARIGSPHDCRRTIHFHRNILWIVKGFDCRQITSQD